MMSCVVSAHRGDNCGETLGHRGICGVSLFLVVWLDSGWLYGVLLARLAQLVATIGGGLPVASARPRLDAEWRNILRAKQAVVSQGSPAWLLIGSLLGGDDTSRLITTLGHPRGRGRTGDQV